MSSPDRITRLLQRANDGDAHALDEVMPLVYEELRRLAHAKMRKVPPGQTLQPTALVHEAYALLREKGDGPDWANRRHFFYAASRAMNDLLVADARRKAALKRGGDRQQVELDSVELAFESPVEDVVAMDSVLRRLEQQDALAHELVMVRFFAGLSVREAAEALQMSVSSVERKWRFARAWLLAELGPA